MSTSYNEWLVLLSLVIAFIASYTTLSLAERVQASVGAAGNYWILGGAFSMGLGIWSMHFIGMLAFHLPIPIAYDAPLTLASILPAFVASGIALYTIRAGRKSPLTLIGAGLLMGVGIAAMHYTGMAAMRMLPAIRYTPSLFWLSILIAIGASIAALEIAFRLKEGEFSRYLVGKKIGSALVMGFAIAGMHYTGMAAANFAEGSVCLAAPQGINAGLLATLVGTGSVVVLSMTLMVSIFDARMAGQNALMVEGLRRANEELQQRAQQLAEGMTAELRAIGERDRLLAAVVEQSSDAIVTRDLNHLITSWNQAAERMFGYTKEEIVGASIDQILEVPAGPQGRVAFSRLSNPEQLGEVLGKRRGGGYFNIALSNAQLFDEEQRTVGMISILRDITQSKRSEQRLQQAAVVFESTSEGVVITDENGFIIAVNRAFIAITGYSEDEAIGQQAGFTKSGLHNKAFYQDMWADILRQGHWRGEVIDRRKSGETYPKWLSISEVRNDRGQISNYVGVFNDITQLKETQSQLQYIAQHDFLTDLPNRMLLGDRLEHALTRAKRTRTLVALLFLDLDRFKNINDSLGHVVGDHLLVGVANRIQAVIREEDTLARLGGDEFIVVLESLMALEQAAIVAEKIIEAMGRPFFIDDHELFVSTSIGISCYPRDGEESIQLLKHADSAMYKAKEEGRNKYRYYSAEFSSSLSRRFELEGELRRAIEKKEFLLYYQPLVSPRDGQILGAEALIRWEHPKRGVISPGEFLPIAEEAGLLPLIEEWVIDAACRQLRQWWDQRLPSTKVAVNLSSELISYHNVAERITAILEREQLDGSALQFEITETSLVKHTEMLINNLEALDELGISIAIDDFGTGYSSMAYLKRFAVSKLKIDQSFVRDIAIDPNDKAIVKAVILMGHSLGLTITAEGVETLQQRAFLLGQGCDELQGYLFSRPLPAAAFAQLLVSNHGILKPQSG
jgi:diguanylate cyclase (GGDEF)-like protein/PAS domain S-box-containing protein